MKDGEYECGNASGKLKLPCNAEAFIIVGGTGKPQLKHAKQHIRER
jgi:hypothetical protein